MKKVLIVALALFTLNVCKAEGPQINLHLNRANKYASEDKALLGTAMAVTGAILCTAILLEGNSSYNSAWQKDASGNLTRYELPFMLQTPKQFFFAAGATVSITGIIMAIQNSRSRH